MKNRTNGTQRSWLLPGVFLVLESPPVRLSSAQLYQGLEFASSLRKGHCLARATHSIPRSPCECSLPVLVRVEDQVDPWIPPIFPCYTGYGLSGFSGRHTPIPLAALPLSTVR